MKKTILFLTSRLPYPPIGGDRLKNYWLLKILSKHFKVHLVSIAEEDIPKQFYNWADEIGITYKIFRKQKRDFYFNAFKGLFNNLPLQVNYYYFKDVQEYIDSVYKEYDLLFATLVRTSAYVINKEKPKILDMADSIGLNYAKSKEKTKSIFWKLIYGIESKRLINYEKLCIEKFDKTLFFNQEEEKYFNNPMKTIWIPHGVNENLLKYNKTDETWKNSIVFFGKMNYQPNIDATLWFIENVLPKINKNLQFVVVGAYPPESLKKLESKYKNLKILGYVDDPYVILKSSLCIVAPMQTGGGIQNKVLESMALGTINIVSSLAAKPIGAKHGEHFFVCDKPDEIVKLINYIYQNPEKYEMIKKNAREYIRNNFTWSIYEKKLLRIIEEVLS
ncbi:glycosyltransferase family 4 protein [Venenivibrio stagnispumantis]|uniref:Glycosyltransferase involved in cell wall bisynthesis n=1 Tax=Venenivibrio stagnispumantis TaxID=407998 RepID=A0AA45WNA8_9AQUI|nr:glycosyltransferase family 4 protein [Venenivibrio stagnispumantis]MCW4573212.1 glycosyltransferase family 4 protein [Venenivibrio stagnispumantis]SMP17293.1 Glycosyltransferase involved in cell wall bisynthesis [Venenivibrio stagnispumantis]